jgi:hypothetical protein
VLDKAHRFVCIIPPAVISPTESKWRQGVTHVLGLQSQDAVADRKNVL